MDKASIFGVLAGIGLVLTSILLGGSLGSFIQIQGMLVVAGGTFAATAIAFPTDDLKLLLPVSRRVFNDPGNEMIAITQYLVKAMAVFKKGGAVALEELADDAPTSSLRKGLLLVADRAEAGTMKEILSTEQKYVEEHHRVGQKIFKEMGAFAPAFGMVGTLIGLVQMLSDMSDPDAIGPAMAVALLTTFYGAVMANLLFLPMVTKLDRRIQIETTQIQLAIVGLISMSSGDTSTIMKEKLKAFLSSDGAQAEEAVEAAPAAV